MRTELPMQTHRKAHSDPSGQVQSEAVNSPASAKRNPLSVVVPDVVLLLSSTCWQRQMVAPEETSQSRSEDGWWIAILVPQSVKAQHEARDILCEPRNAFRHLVEPRRQTGVETACPQLAEVCS